MGLEVGGVAVEGSSASCARGETVLVIQLTLGFVRSRNGIPRRREWEPIGATRKVSFWETAAMV